MWTNRVSKVADVNGVRQLREAGFQEGCACIKSRRTLVCFNAFDLPAFERQAVLAGRRAPTTKILPG